MIWFILAFISAVFSAAAAISEKKVLNSINALDFSFIVSFVTFIFSIPFFFGINYDQLSTFSLFILLLKTIMGAAAFLCVMISIKNLEISKALPLLALSPGIVAFFAAFLLGDHLKYMEWVGIFLMLVGTYILELKQKNEGFFGPLKSLFSFQKYKFVFLAILLFTVTSLLDRLLLKQYSLPPFAFMAFQQLFYVLFFLVIVLFKKVDVITVTKSYSKNIIYLIIAVSVFTVIYRYTQIEATKLAPVAMVLSVKRLSVLMAIIIGGKMFNEDNLSKRIIATIVILAGTTILMIG